MKRSVITQQSTTTWKCSSFCGARIPLALGTPKPPSCAVAATQGSYDCLKWAHENGCPWDETAAYGAAMDGRAKTLAYCVEEGCPHDVDECISRARASGKEGLADYLCLREELMNGELGAEIEEDLIDIFLEELE